MTCIFLQLYTFDFYLDEICTNTTNYILIFTIFVNNPYSRPTCWIFFLTSSVLNWGTYNSVLHYVRNYLGNFNFNPLKYFHLLPHILFSVVLFHLESFFLRLIPSIKHLIIKYPYQIHHFPSWHLILCLIFFETTQHQPGSSMGVQYNDDQNLYPLKNNFS